MRNALPLIAVLITAGCGYLGNPLPPLANVPSPVSNLSATQRGSELLVQFLPPQVTLENFPIKQPIDLDVRAGPASKPLDAEVWTVSARKLPPISAGNPAAGYQMPVAEWVGKDLTVGVRAVGANGKRSSWSFVSTPIVAPIQPPANVRAENTATGVRLTWNSASSGAGIAFRVLRKTDATNFAPVADVPQPPWTDPASQFGAHYSYKVQTIETLPEDHHAESELSAEVSFTPEDKFPPATPSEIQIALAPNYFQLSWTGSTEPDLASYRVYRSVGGGPFERVTEVELPAFSDRDVEPGKVYRYEVTAVDRAGNESPRSNAVEARLQ
jgi:hypothetical protein